MNLITCIKSIASIGSSLAVGMLVGNAVKATTPKNIGKIMKTIIGFGSMVVASALSEIACKYTEDSIDKTVEMVRECTDEKVSAEQEYSLFKEEDAE